MSDEQTKPHSAIRTFAKDLATARGRKNQVTPDGSSADTNKTKSKIPTPPYQNFKAQAPQQTTHTEPDILAVEKNPVLKEEPVEKNTVHTQTKIPAFHELKKEIREEVEKNAQPVEKKSPQNKIVPKITVNKKSRKPARANIGYDSAIITDTKDSPFNLFGAIGNSLKSWFHALTTSRKKKAPVYTVPETQRRKGIIQRATSKSGSIFTADSAELRARIKRRQKLAQEQMDHGEPEVSWSPYTDAGFKLLESPEETARLASPHNVAVEFKKQAEITGTAPVLQPPVPPAPPIPVVEPENEISVVAAVEPATAALPNTETEPLPTPQPPTAHHQEESADAHNLDSKTLSTNALAMSVVAGLTVVVVVFFIGKTVFEFITTSETEIVADTTLYLQSATPNPVVVTQTNSITDIPLQADSSLEATYVDTKLFAPGGETIPPATIISALEFAVLPSFTQSLTDIRFAQINDSAPIIVFTFTDADTALGGFLAWERTMAKDLRGIYPTPEIDNLTFTDTSIQNTDARVLTSSSGEIVAVYGIVSDNTAIITDSPETFTQVLSASFSD